MDATNDDFLRQALGVLSVFALLGLAVWKLRAGGSVPWSLPSGTPRLRATARIALSPQHTVHLLRVDQRELLIATHPQGCSVLSDAPVRESEA